MLITPKIEKMVLLPLLAIILAVAWLKPLDETAKPQVEAGLKRALVSFAVARTLNAVISVAQGTEVAIQPMGIGINFSIGQILDPVNDLVEKFAEFMLIASVAFGIMDILLRIGQFWIFSLLLSVAAASWVLLRWQGKVPPTLLSKILFALLMIRFIVPLVTIGSDAVYQQFLAGEYSKSQNAVELSSSQLKLSDPNTDIPNKTPAATPSDKPSWITGWLPQKPASNLVTENEEPTNWQAAKERIKNLKNMAEQIVSHVIKLIVVFLLQTLVIPLILFWALYRVGLALFNSPQRSKEANLPV
ncbi:MAG TPA: hypothetical protein VMW07_00235 [Gallionella sp.]|nr:hypothetical protein [Gallionella sp.]